MRLDKYLKVSRIIKRRTVANDACDAEHVKVNGRPAKASYDVKEGDILESKIERGCVDIEALKKYQGKSPYLYGLEVFMPRKYSTPKTLAEFGLNRPPQSWCYTEVCVK